MFFCDRLCTRARMRVASSRSAVIIAIAASAALARDCASARSFSASTLSSRATTWPACTIMPSSISTSTTLPVISAAIVALRRATTKPDAARLPARRGSALTAGACGGGGGCGCCAASVFGAAGEAQLRNEQRKRDHGRDRGAGGRDQHRPTPPGRPRRVGASGRSSVSAAAWPCPRSLPHCPAPCLRRRACEVEQFRDRRAKLTACRGSDQPHTSRTQPRSQRCAGSASSRGCQSNETVTSGIETGSGKLCIPARRFPV